MSRKLTDNPAFVVTIPYADKHNRQVIYNMMANIRHWNDCTNWEIIKAAIAMYFEHLKQKRVYK